MVVWHKNNPRLPKLTEEDFEQRGAEIARRKVASSLRTRQRRFSAWFHSTPREVAITWNLLCLEGYLDELGPNSVNPDHLLWALMFMKVYTNETVFCSIAGCCEKTFRKWVWFYMEAIANLDVKVVSLYLLFFAWLSILPTHTLYFSFRYDGATATETTMAIGVLLPLMAPTSKFKSQGPSLKTGTPRSSSIVDFDMRLLLASLVETLLLLTAPFLVVQAMI